MWAELGHTNLFSLRFFCSIKKLFLNPTEKVPSQQLKPLPDPLGLPRRDRRCSRRTGGCWGPMACPWRRWCTTAPCATCARSSPHSTGASTLRAWGTYPGPSPLSAREEVRRGGKPSHPSNGALSVSPPPASPSWDMLCILSLLLSTCFTG